MPRSKPRPLEREVVATCLEILAAWGVDARRQNTGAAKYGDRLVRFGQPGDPDITGTLWDGRRLDLEVKRPGEQPRPEQIERLQKTNAMGGVGLWVSDGLQLIHALQRLKQGWRVEIDHLGQQTLTDEPET